MSDKFVCTNPDIIIITFDEIFKSVVIHTINMVYNIYNNLDLIGKLNSDIKKIISYSILDQIYSRLSYEKEGNYILYINTSFTTFFSEIWTYIDKSKLEQFIIKICNTISQNIPIPILVENGIVDLTKDCGETDEIINKLNYTLMSFQNNTLTLNKLKKFSKKNGFKHFVDKYYSRDDFKNNMFYNKYLKGVNQP